MGQWTGVVQQTSGYLTPYTAVVEINDFHTGAIVGTSHYPDFNCGGNLLLVSASATQAILTETITYGSCLNGQIRLNYSSASQVLYNWFRTSGVQWVFNKPLTRSEPVICGNPELRTTYSATTAGYHFYTHDSLICSPGEGSGAIPCDAPTIYALMLSRLKFVAPPGLTNANSPVTDCGVYDLIPTPLPNPITTKTFPSILAVLNYTMVGHIFHPGVVGRIVFTAPDSSVHVLTIGMGTGPHGVANQSLGPWLFGQLDGLLRESYLGQ